MKRILLWAIILVLTSCSSTRFVDSWKNSEVSALQPDKLLVIGMTDNLTARKIFEQELKTALTRRNIKAEESSIFLDGSFTESKKSQEEINAMIAELSADGFDAVMITAVKGVDENRSYTRGYYTVRYNWQRFGRYYFRYQDVYYHPGYYDDYKVYHVETSLYDIKADENKSLVWVGSFDIVNPRNITSTVDDYVEKIIQQLEQEGLIDAL
ncbi:hypothetical protein WIW50_03345 [Flavobacteriaceae bacterium 3-367]|uniref:hypothetical protein n=1 Tax=Eudoraea algarum TaxID=3417568 RepID=UPI003279DA31